MRNLKPAFLLKTNLLEISKNLTKFYGHFDAKQLTQLSHPYYKI